MNPFTSPCALCGNFNCFEHWEPEEIDPLSVLAIAAEAPSAWSAETRRRLGMFAEGPHMPDPYGFRGSTPGEGEVTCSTALPEDKADAGTCNPTPLGSPSHNLIRSSPSSHAAPSHAAASAMTSPVQTADVKPVVFGQQQQHFPGWVPADAQYPQQPHQHQSSLSGLEHHADQYTHAPVQNPPQLHRISSDANATSGREKVPIERQRSRTGVQSGSITPTPSPTEGTNEQAMVVQQSGPMSSSVTVPSRPRPGRKPLPQEEASDRRRMQNRLAQRNFRDKRQQKLQEALEELDRCKKENHVQVGELTRTLEETRTSARQFQAELQTMHQRLDAMERRADQSERARSLAEQRAQELARRNEELEKRLQQAQLPSNISNFRPAYPTANQSSPIKDVATPPSEKEMEIDYTNWFGRKNQSGYGLNQTVTNDSDRMDYTVQAEDQCGFCTDSQNCACAQVKAAVTEKPAPVSVPGSCDQCRADPVRAQACRDMAKSTQIAARDSTMSATNSMPPPPRTTCASMVDSFNKYGERTSSIASLFGGRQLNTYPATSGGGYEFEEKEAAEVLSNLSRRSTMAESPKAEQELESVSPRS